MNHDEKTAFIGELITTCALGAFALYGVLYAVSAVVEAICKAVGCG